MIREGKASKKEDLSLATRLSSQKEESTDREALGIGEKKGIRLSWGFSWRRRLLRQVYGKTSRSTKNLETRPYNDF